MGWGLQCCFPSPEMVWVGGTPVPGALMCSCACAVTGCFALSRERCACAAMRLLLRTLRRFHPSCCEAAALALEMLEAAALSLGCTPSGDVHAA